MTEMSDERDALNLARSRFEVAQLAWQEAFSARQEAQKIQELAWEVYELAADDLAVASRRVLHTIASGGES